MILHKCNRVANADTKRTLISKPYIVIIGSSNSLMVNGWADHFKKEYEREFDVVNLSLGATSSVYIAYVVSQNTKLLSEASYVILEPFVNDVSFYRMSLSHRVLELSLMYYYLHLSSINNNVYVLLLPTRKRVRNISSNNVYKMHMHYAQICNAFIIDCHPFFESNPSIMGNAFKDDAHLVSSFSCEVAHQVHDVLESGNGSKVVSSSKLGVSDDEIKIVDLVKPTTKKTKESSYFALDISDFNDFYISAPPRYVLGGVLHWCDSQNSEIVVSSCGISTESTLRSKFLKLSTFPFDAYGSCRLTSEKNVGLSSVIFFKNKYSVDSTKKFGDRGCLFSDVPLYRKISLVLD